MAAKIKSYGFMVCLGKGEVGFTDEKQLFDTTDSDTFQPKNNDTQYKLK